MTITTAPLSTDEELTEVARAAIHGASFRRATVEGKLARLRKFADGRTGIPDVPEGASEELQGLADSSVLNMCGPAASAFAHGLSVTGFRSPQAQDNDPAWEWWQAQNLDARQHEVHDATVVYGWSYVSVLPEGDGVDESPAEARIWSPLDVDAVYEDARHDRFPISATLWRRVEGGWSVLFIDDTTVTPAIVPASLKNGRKKLRLEDVETTGEPWEHGATYRGKPVTPLVLFPNERVADDRDPRGEVEPLIPLQLSLNEVNFDRLVAARFSVFNQKVILGWSASREQVLRASNSRVWTFEDHPSDVSVQSLPASPMTPYNELIRELKEQIALTAAIPIYQATGSVANVSENTVAMVDKAYQAKLSVKQDLLGEAWETVLRLAVNMTGGEVTDESDDAAEVMWRDTRPRSFGAVVDGVGKLSAEGVPIGELIDLVPGISQQRADAIRDSIARTSGADALRAAIAAASQPSRPAAEAGSEGV